MIGVPLLFVVGILMTLSPEFSRELHVKGIVSAGAAVAACYGGLVAGDILSGLISQWLKSRKKVVVIFLLFNMLTLSAFFLCDGITSQGFYIISFLLGLSVGYRVIFMTVAAEQFGTNIRATVTTTVPNFVRASVIPLTFLFRFIRNTFHQNRIDAGIAVGSLCLAMAFVSVYFMKETFSKDLDYVENA